MRKSLLVAGLVVFPALAFATRIDVNHADQVRSGNDSRVAGCDSTQIQDLSKQSRDVNVKLIENQKNWNLYDLNGVKREYVDPENLVWIENNPKHVTYRQYWNRVNQNNNLMAADSNQGLNFQCSTNSDKYCKSGDTQAYVMFFLGKPRKTIYLCPIFWKNTESTKASIIYHELSHYAASTEDFAGDWWNKNNIQLLRGAMDAYHMEEFYSNTPVNVLKRVVWTWWWPRRP